MGKKDFLENFIGTHGNIIIYRVGNQIRTRVKPEKIRMPQTPAVVKAKEQFKRVNALAKSLYHKTNKLAGPEITPNEGINAYAELVKLIRWSGVDSSENESFWNWDVLKLSSGSLGKFNIQITNKQNSFSLDWSLPKDFAHKDILYVIVIDKITEEVDVFTVELEKKHVELEKQTLFNYPNDSSKVVYAFRLQHDSDLTKKSDSVFLGEITESVNEVVVEVKPDFFVEINPEVKVEPTLEDILKAEAQALSEPKLELFAEVKTSILAESKPDKVAEVKPESVVVESKPKDLFNTKPEVKIEPKQEENSEPKPEEISEPKPETKPERQPLFKLKSKAPKKETDQLGLF